MYKKYHLRLKVFIGLVITIQLVCYLSWAFVTWSLYVPLIKTFSTSEGLSSYFTFIVFLLWTSLALASGIAAGIENKQFRPSQN